MSVALLHRTWTQPVPSHSQAGVLTRYLAVCCCGWRQPEPSDKPSHAWRAAKRHRQRED